MQIPPWTDRQRRVRRIAPLMPLALLVVGGACSDSITEGSSGARLRVSHEPLAPLEEVAFDALGEHRIAFWRSGLPGGGLHVLDGPTGEVTSHFGGSWFDWPAVAPDGTELLVVRSVFFAGTDLYVLSMEGLNVRLVRAGAAGVYQGPAAWTPDGRIVLVEREPGLPRVRIRTAEPVEGGGQGSLLYDYSEALPSGSDRARPAASASGRVAIPARQSTAPGGLHLSSPGGADFELVQVPQESEDSGILRLDAVAWSPDGGELALLETLLVNSTSLERHQIRVRVLDFETGSTRLVTTVPTASHGEFLRRGSHSICWTPDGTSIAFTAHAGPFGSDLFLVPAAGGDPVLLVRTGDGDERFDGSVSCLG